MPDINHTLESIGLTRNEIKVYITLLKLGPTKAGKISKEAELNRTGTYDALQKLLEKGVISYVLKGEVKWFQPENPIKMGEYIDEQKENFNRIMPELAGLYSLPKESRNVRLYKGYKGLKAVFQDILKERKPNDVFGSEGEFSEKMPYYAPHFVKELEERKIKVRNLVRKGRSAHPSKTTEIRYVPDSKTTESPVVTNIYGDKIAIIMWTDMPEAIIIHNRAAAASYRSYFELMWKNAEKSRYKK